MANTVAGLTDEQLLESIELIAQRGTTAFEQVLLLDLLKEFEDRHGEAALDAYILSTGLDPFFYRRRTAAGSQRGRD